MFVGECVCNTDYHGNDCSISRTAGPDVESLADSGLCDLEQSVTNCSEISVYGDKFVESDDLACHIEELEV